jgi:hypothetical protein
VVAVVAGGLLALGTVVSRPITRYLRGYGNGEGKDCADDSKCCYLMEFHSTSVPFFWLDDGVMEGFAQDGKDKFGVFEIWLA